MFQNINLAVLTLTSTCLVFNVYQNEWAETARVGQGGTEIYMSYGAVSFYGPGSALIDWPRTHTFDYFELEYEQY